MSQGRIVSLGKPEELKRKISGDVIVIQSQNAALLAQKIQERFQVTAKVLEAAVQIEHEKGAEFITPLAGAFASEIESITVRKPTLEDVFIQETGHRFWDEEKERAHE